MDAGLRKQREEFLKRAAAHPAVEKRPAKVSKDSRHAQPQSSQPHSESSYNYRHAQASSSVKNSVLHKIITYMKKRFLEGESHALTVEQILDETKQLDVSARIRLWLEQEALLKNTKIRRVDENGVSKFLFRPVMDLPDWKGLRKKLDYFEMKGLGGIFMDDVEESLPDADNAVQKMGDRVVVMTRQQDKRKVLFYNDINVKFKVDEDLQRLWRSVAVESIDEQKVEEYLKKNGITSMQDSGIRKVNEVQKRRNPGGKRKSKQVQMKHNDHMAGVLQDYSHLRK